MDVNSIDERIIEICNRIFVPLFESAEDETDRMVADGVQAAMLEALKITGKIDFEDKELDEIFRDSVKKGIMLAVEYSNLDNPLYWIARTFDSPGRWYYNLSEAVKYYLISVVTENCARASFNLGCIFFNGMKDEKNNYEIKKNYSKAAAYYYCACILEDPMEECKYLYCLAECYFYGWGVKPDMLEVIQLGHIGHKYKEPSNYYGRLCNLAMLAMNIKDGNTDVIPDEVIEKAGIVSVGVPGFHNSIQQEVLNSKESKIEIFLYGLKHFRNYNYFENCPKCGAPMVMRTSDNIKNGYRYPMFLGCTSYPKCTEVVKVLPDRK